MLNKNIFIALLMLVLNSSAQLDSCYWHYGLKLNYSTVFYPNRSPYLFYNYSYQLGLNVFSEKAFKKKPRLNTRLEIGYSILKLNEKLFHLDSTVWQTTPTLYDNVNFTYSNINVNFSLNKKISSLYAFGIGVSLNYFELNKKTGYKPYVHYSTSNCLSCDSYYVLDYNATKHGYSVYITINNTFFFYKRHSLGLDLILDPVGIYYWASEPKYPFGGYTFYTGINVQPLNYINFNYRLYLR